LGEGVSLGEAGRRQREFGAAAEAGGRDAVDMAVAGEKEAGHPELAARRRMPDSAPIAPTMIPLRITP
jgi:hypothetical protein